MSPKVVLNTDRLVLRELELGDADFILELLNDPSFLRFIGDKNVRTVEEAREHLRTGPMDSYGRHGFGMWAVEPLGGGRPMGICGLVKRDWLDDVDVGFAFLPPYWSNGYGFESASAVLAHARDVVGLERVVAITAHDNAASIGLLETSVLPRGVVVPRRRGGGFAFCCRPWIIAGAPSPWRSPGCGDDHRRWDDLSVLLRGDGPGNAPWGGSGSVHRMSRRLV